MPPRSQRLAKLPGLLDRKLYKTGQTRGATMREIYQNRVGRNSTVLVPYEFWDACRVPDDGTESYENGFIVLLEPSWYFESPDADTELAAQGLQLGDNAILLYQRRADWTNYSFSDGATMPNGLVFKTASDRVAPIGGTYMSRVHSTTATTGGQAVVQGFDTTALRGAGIRVYEYASSASLAATRLQLEALFWLCWNSAASVLDAGMATIAASRRREVQMQAARDAGLLDLERLRKARMIDHFSRTICPLCLELIDANDFMRRGEQAEGRVTYDNTITEVSLFHIEELRVGKLQHKPYNLGWGHHFCNVVVKDAGIMPTIKWMKKVLDNNGNSDEAIAQSEASVEEGVQL